MTRRTAWWIPLAFLAGTLTLPSPTFGQPSLTSSEMEGTLAALEIQQEMDRRLLLSDRLQYQELIQRRRQITGRLNSLYTQLEDLYERLLQGGIQVEEALDLQERMSQLEQMVQSAEMERDLTRDESRLLRGKMREKGLRLTMLAQQIGELRNTSLSRRGVLTGRWDVKILPSDVHGSFVLRQEGTLVSGRYSVSPDRTGSFTGTIVGNRVTLQQVDSTYGRDGVFYGNLSRDGDSIEGTWESVSLGTGRPSFGVWKASRVPEESSEESDGAAQGSTQGP